MSVVALVGNPREGSRTLTVAVEAATAVLETSLRSACGKFLLSQFRHWASACACAHTRVTPVRPPFSVRRLW